MADRLDNGVRKRQNLVVKTGSFPALSTHSPTVQSKDASTKAKAAIRAQALAHFPAYFFIRQQGRWQKIVVAEIRFIESRKNYSKLSTESGDFLALVPLKRLEALLSPLGFARVHRAYIVSIDWIISFDRHTITGSDGQKIPLSEMYRPALLDRLVLMGDQYKRTKNDTGDGTLDHTLD